jgi:hypothetical protein
MAWWLSARTTLYSTYRTIHLVTKHFRLLSSQIIQKYAYNMTTVRAGVRACARARVCVSFQLLILTKLGVNFRPLRDAAKTKVYETALLGCYVAYFGS